MMKPTDKVFDSQAICAELDAILQTDSDLESFEIVPQPAFQNASPVLHVDHHLGLESWCIKDLYCFVHQQLLSTEIENQRPYLAVALLLNPNVKTYWNSRKKLMLNGDLNVGTELNFVAVLMSHKPKAQDLYNHRKWILSMVFQQEKIPPEFFLKELEVIEKAASKHVNNHVAWNLASYLLTHVKSATILQDFWRISHKWVSINVSDFSGMHFHQRVLIRLIETSDQLDEDFKSSIVSSSENYLNNFFSSKNTKDDFLGVFFAIHLVSSEFELNDSLINFYGSHESLWAQRRFLSYLLVKQLPEIVSEENMKLFFHITDESPANNNVVSYLQMINASCFKNVTDCKLFIERYNHWMKHLEVYPADI